MLAKLDSWRSISLLALGTASVLSRTALRCSFGSGGSRPSDWGGRGVVLKKYFRPVWSKNKGATGPSPVSATVLGEEFVQHRPSLAPTPRKQPIRGGIVPKGGSIVVRGTYGYLHNTYTSVPDTCIIWKPSVTDAFYLLSISVSG